MSRGNDAIPSWSGFNYQGRMMLLCAVEKMNELIRNGKSISSYEVELEKKEDFAFKEAGEYNSFYQVKACLSLNKWSQYNEALGKLLKHRNDSTNPSAKCYFVVAREFADWADAANVYNSLVEIYRYNSQTVDLLDVKKDTIDEIEKLLFSAGRTALNSEAVYGALCIFLEDSIASMHKQKYAKRKYVISFSRLYEVIINAVSKQNEDVEYTLRERIYNHMCQTVDDAICDICSKKCGINFDACNKPCAAKRAVELILELSNIRDYCRLINPTEHEIWDNPLRYIDHFQKWEVEKYILTVFAESINHALINADGNAVGMKSVHNPIGRGIVIPTLLRFEEPYMSIEDSMQSKLQKIKDNSANLHELYGNSIIVDSFDTFNDTTLSQVQITAAWEEVKEKSITVMEDDIGFISYKEILKKFAREGGNHE